MNAICRLFIFITVAMTFFYSSPSRADTVILKSGDRIKGLILEEFKDRIVLSTVQGEKTIMKSAIRSAIYDSEEKALMQKGRNQLKKGQYIRSYQTYEKVVELDPGLDEARERLNYLRSYLETKARHDVLDGLRAKRERFENARSKTPAQRLFDELGLVIAPGEKYVSIEKVSIDTVRESGSGLEPGDRIVAVWGEMTAFMDVEEVSEVLLAPGEIRMTIERMLRPELSSAGKMFKGLFSPGYRKIAGAVIELKKEGYVVGDMEKGGPFEKAGIRSGDLLCRINGANTRYMPMRELDRVLEENQNERIEVVVRRDVTLWKKE
ncbi:MAG: PDZ domain-containing protein [Candidatus Omnitrophota bacterium]|nr:PDZ domain-containing protein [Candidatus Omnitrophota bacterium]